MSLKILNATAAVEERLKLMGPHGSLIRGKDGSFRLANVGTYNYVDHKEDLIRSVHSVGNTELIKLAEQHGNRCNISTFGEVSVLIGAEGNIEIRLERTGARVIVDGYERGKFEAKKEIFI